MQAKVKVSLKTDDRVGESTVVASDPLVHWVGRTMSGAELGSGAPTAVYFDWEGVSASVNVKNYTYLTVKIADNCPGSPSGGGARWAVSMTTSDTYRSTTQHRISTFLTASQISDYVLFNLPGGWTTCNPLCNKVDSNTTRFTLTRLTESRLSGCSAVSDLPCNIRREGRIIPCNWRVIPCNIRRKGV